MLTRAIFVTALITLAAFVVVIQAQQPRPAPTREWVPVGKLDGCMIYEARTANTRWTLISTCPRSN